MFYLDLFSRRRVLNIWLEGISAINIYFHPLSPVFAKERKFVSPEISTNRLFLNLAGYRYPFCAPQSSCPELVRSWFVAFSDGLEKKRITNS